MKLDSNVAGAYQLFITRLPYAPSHLLPLASLTSSLTHFQLSTRSSTIINTPTTSNTPPIRNVIDMIFLPGFNEPTLALLYAPEPTWPGRLENVSSNFLVSLVTLASGPIKLGNSSHASSTTAVVIATSPPLPHSCLAIYPCPPDLGGTLVVTANGVLHLEQGGKLVGVAANGWFDKEWSGRGGTGVSTVREALEGVQLVFVENEKALLFCKSGAILELTLTRSGRSVTSMKLDKTGTGVPASCVERIRGSVGRFGEQGYAFVGSEVGESSLISWALRSSGSFVNTIESTVSAPDTMDVDVDVDDEDGQSFLFMMLLFINHSWFRSIRSIRKAHHTAGNFKTKIARLRQNGDCVDCVRYDRNIWWNQKYGHGLSWR